MGCASLSFLRLVHSVATPVSAHLQGTRSTARRPMTLDPSPQNFSFNFSTRPSATPKCRPCPLPKPQNREQFVASLEPTHAANRLTCILHPAEAFLALVLHRPLSSRRCDTDPVTTPLALFVHRPPHDARHTTPLGSLPTSPTPPRGPPRLLLQYVGRNGERDQADQWPEPPRTEREHCEAVRHTHPPFVSDRYVSKFRHSRREWGLAMSPTPRGPTYSG